MADIRRPILLSNESPILVISRSSLNRLNEQVKANGGNAVKAEVFRANIVVAEDLRCLPGLEQPYAEDSWTKMRIGQQHFQMLGSCRRCQMVCINQSSGVKGAEPFATLAKERRVDGKVFFGVHASHVAADGDWSASAQSPSISVGDSVTPSRTMA